MRRLSFLYVILLAVSGCASPKTQAPASEPALDTILMKMNQRLALMEQVALFKYRKGLPAEDLAREQSMLNGLADRAAPSLTPTAVRWFFSAQVQAAKMVQENHFHYWREHGAPPDETPEMAKIREQIDAVNDDLIQALAAFRQHRPKRQRIQERAGELIRGNGIDDAVRSAAIRPLLEVE